MNAPATIIGSIRLKAIVLTWSLLIFALPMSATVLADVRGVVHDLHHRPISGAQATLQSSTSDFRKLAESDAGGTFEFSAVPLGNYTITVEASGFAPEGSVVMVASGSAPILHYQLAVAALQQQVNVTAASGEIDTESVTRTTLVTRKQIERYAGASSSNSLRMFTEFLPGASVVHDQLHLRGGHQVTWAIDGVPIPNTNIASNVGPQFNPRDIDYLESQSGSFAADSGDRTYGVFNVAARSGFERTRQAEFVASYGAYNSTDNQLSFADHSEKFAYYASLNGNRTGHGLESPSRLNLHNEAWGGSGFTSLIYNPTNHDQLRFNLSLRGDFYQVPNDQPAQNIGVRDSERERDGFAVLSWVHTLSPGVLISISPFYHFNRAVLQGGPTEVNSITNNRASEYEGGQFSVAAVAGKHNARVGVYAFAQRDTTLFSLVANDGSGSAFRQRLAPGGNIEALFLQDQFKATSWLTLTGGVRLTHFEGLLNENAADPRIGVAIRLPRVHWVVRSAYSRFYQAPPLATLSGPLLKFAAAQGATFSPLHGERDEQHEFGITIPVHGWITDLAYFRTGARRFFDHDVIGNSNVFLPITIASARIRGYEATVRSPLLLEHFHAHFVFSDQQAQGFGGVTGGLFNFAPPQAGGFYLDHDQRKTLSAGVDGDLPRHCFAAMSVHYGSGFLDGNGPGHLPSQSTFDLSLGKSFGENLTISASSTNTANRRYQLDTSNSFGGSHWGDPRMLALQVHYRFHY